MMDPVYATAQDMWQLALPPDTLFQDQDLEPGQWTVPVKTGSGLGSMGVELASNPRSDFIVIVKCVTAGEINVYGVLNPGPVPQFVISLNNGLTFSQVLTPLEDGFLAYQKGGFSLRFTNGVATSFVVNDQWTFLTQSSPDILRFLSAASRFIDGKLKNTYCTPLKTWGDDLTLITCQIARWFMLQRRGMDKNQDFEIYNPKDAFKWLNETGKGDNQADVLENGNGFTFPQWMVASRPYKTFWRF